MKCSKKQETCLVVHSFSHFLEWLGNAMTCFDVLVSSLETLPGNFMEDKFSDRKEDETLKNTGVFGWSRGPVYTPVYIDNLLL